MSRSQLCSSKLLKTRKSMQSFGIKNSMAAPQEQLLRTSRRQLMVKTTNGLTCTQVLLKQQMRKDSMTLRKSSVESQLSKSITKNVTAHCLKTLN